MESEDDLKKIISNVQFRRVKNDFQYRLKNYIRSIQSSKKVIVFADKTRNIYEMEKSHYKKLLTEKHTNNLITTFTTVLIWKQNILQKNLK